MKRTLLSAATIILATIATANAQRLEIVAGQRAETSSAKHYLRGMTDPDARIEVNGRTFKVYPTGAFAAEVQLTEGDNKVTVKAVRPDGSTREESFDIRYTLPQKPQPVEGFAIERFTTVPARIEAVSVGDQIILQAKATPGCRMTCAGDVEMKELPAEEAGCAGIYQGRITVRENDPRLAAPLKAELSDGTNTATAELKNAIEESVRYLKAMGAHCVVFVDAERDYLPGEIASAAYDFFEDAVEAALDSITSCAVSVSVVEGVLRIRVTVGCREDLSPLGKEWPDASVAMSDENEWELILPLRGGAGR